LPKSLTTRLTASKQFCLIIRKICLFLVLKNNPNKRFESLCKQATIILLIKFSQYSVYKKICISCFNYYFFGFFCLFVLISCFNWCNFVLRWNYISFYTFFYCTLFFFYNLFLRFFISVISIYLKICTFLDLFYN